MAARVLPLREIKQSLRSDELKEKNESLGVRVNDLINLINHGFDVSDAFVLTQKAYLDFLSHNNLEKKVKHLLTSGASNFVDKHLKQAELPKNLIDEILKEYKKFGTVLEDANVNVNGQKIGGDAALIEKIRELWSGRLEGGGSLADRRGENNAILVQKIHYGKHGKLRTSSKFINTIYSLSDEEIFILENLIAKFKKLFYLPYEIDFTLEKGKALINKIKPEAHVALQNLEVSETHYKIIRNSAI